MTYTHTCKVHTHLQQNKNHHSAEKTFHTFAHVFNALYTLTNRDKVAVFPVTTNLPIIAE